MSNKHISNGGPAFPVQWYDFQPFTGEQVVREQWGGMTLRDYFAAKAMPVHMAALSNWAAGSPEAWQNEIARLSYATADAMLKAREA